MGYTLAIGEAVIDGDQDFIRISCAPEKHDTAPAFGEVTDYTNERWPSYSGWSDAMRKLDLEPLMFNERNGGSNEFEWNGVHRMPLIYEHPGATVITPEHLAYLEDRVAKYKAKFPDHIAQFPPVKEGAKPLFGNYYRNEDYVDDPKYDGALCRAEWLLYWMRWALANCKRPVFVNS